MSDIALRHTTQSKLTVKAPTLGSGVPTICAVLGAMVAVHILVHCPVSGVGSFNGSLLFCFRKDIVLMSPCVPGWGRRTKNEERRTERRHISCAPSHVARGRFVCHEENRCPYGGKIMPGIHINVDPGISFH
ncbi:hypothetical protein [Desulfosporosinus fructosivorans]